MAQRAAAPRLQMAGAAQTAPLPLLVVLLLLLFAAPPAGASTPGRVSELWKWWPEGGKSAPAGATPAFTCLADMLSGAPRDKKVHSQVGEDGIIEAVFECLGAKDKYYVEFGTQTCKECTTAYLRDKGWSGLLMDGSNVNPAINLHKEYMTSENIADLFQKHNVPHPTFDHLTVDIDQNTFWVLRAVLAAGYRPRLVVAEFNRNFAPTQAYATVDMPKEMAGGVGMGWTCYYGASALAFERLMRAFGYSLVAFDEIGINTFFVHNDERGKGVSLNPELHSFALVTPAPKTIEMWTPNHQDCSGRLWVHVADSPSLAGAQFYRHMRPELLKQTAGPGGLRRFDPIETPGVLTLHQRRRPRAQSP